jgi:hypothetical protein
MKPHRLGLLLACSPFALLAEPAAAQDYINRLQSSGTAGSQPSGGIDQSGIQHFFTMTDCHGAAQALTWTASMSAFGCNNIGNAVIAGNTEGFTNVLRNATLTAWFHGTSGTTSTVVGNADWTAEGVFVVASGAAVTWTQSAGPVGSLGYNALKVTGAASVTDVKLRFVVESYTAAKFAGQTVTFQLPWFNNSGATITPTLTTKYATGGQDGGVTAGGAWAGSTTDLSSVNLQACLNNTSCTEAYTFAANSGATTGYEFIVDLGNNFSTSGKTFTLNAGFDARVTPGATIGLNASPPTPEVRDPASDIQWNYRFWAQSYANGSSAGTATTLNIAGPALTNNAGVNAGLVMFPTLMRNVPTVSYWDSAGTVNKVSVILQTSSAFTAGVTATQPPFNISTASFLFDGSTTSISSAFLHYTADATIWGG